MLHTKIELRQGALYLHAQNVCCRGKLLLREALKVYHTKFRYAAGLLGDQLALADVVRAAVESSNFQRNTSFEAWVMTARTLFLPCSIFNWTPSEGAGQFHGMPNNVKVSILFPWEVLEKIWSHGFILFKHFKHSSPQYRTSKLVLWGWETCKLGHS